VAAGLALSIVSTGKYDEAKSLHDEIVKGKGTCGGASPSAKCADLENAAKLSDALYAPGLGLIIGGAVLAAAGGAYLGYTLRGPAAPSEERPDKPAAGPRITRVGVRGPGLFVEGSF
jgi:hypothetical protein